MIPKINTKVIGNNFQKEVNSNSRRFKISFREIHIKKYIVPELMHINKINFINLGIAINFKNFFK